MKTTCAYCDIATNEELSSWKRNSEGYWYHKACFKKKVNAEYAAMQAAIKEAGKITDEDLQAAADFYDKQTKKKYVYVLFDNINETISSMHISEESARTRMKKIDATVHTHSITRMEVLP